ncbi:MAG: FkbM family methyltransferase [Clostridia bacterium]|nr:FkbM family methyltransferase [Clostridia bacterium]
MTDLWTYLEGCRKDIVIYGMGNGADKIADELERRGLSVAAYFASDDFVRGQSFRGLRVMKFSEIREAFSNFVILIAFASSLPDVMARMYELDAEFEVYAPDVPVVGGAVFDSVFYEEHKESFEKARMLLADEESREIFDAILAYKLTGKLCYLKQATSSYDEVFEKVLNVDRYERCADLGAYNGDSVREFLKKFPKVRSIVSLEPDRRNFKKLSAFVESEELRFVECHHCAAYSHNGEMAFSQSGNRNARAGEGKGSVAVRTLDSILGDRCVDYIKYDVEGSEYEALVGSLSAIRAHRPDLLVSVYHRNEDLFSLILFLDSLDCQYRFYLRRFPYVPAWDLNLYAIAENRKNCVK